MEIKKVLDNVDVVDNKDLDNSTKLMKVLNKLDELIDYCEFMKKFSLKQLYRTDESKNPTLACKFSSYYECFEEVEEKIEQIKKSI